MGEARVHERVMRRHPELSEEDVICARRNEFVVQERVDEQQERRTLIALGVDSKVRLLELTGAEDAAGVQTVFHAMTPPTANVLFELGLG